MAKKNLTLISYRIPSNEVGGGYRMDEHNIKILSRHFNLNYIGITREAPKTEGIDFLEAYTNRYKIFQKTSRYYKFNRFKYFFCTDPRLSTRDYFMDIQQYIDKEMQSTDIAIANWLRSARYLLSYQGPKILNAGDSLYYYYKKIAEQTIFPLRKLSRHLTSQKFLKYEKKLIKMFNYSLFFNRDEVQFFNDLTLEHKAIWLPHGVNQSLFQYSQKSEKYKNCVVFIGVLNYKPNTEAVYWFIQQVLPHLHSELKFIIIGPHPTPKFLDRVKSNHRVEVVGFVDDPYLILYSSVCSVAPMQIGAGIQNKILESMALGVPVVTTTLGGQAVVGNESSPYLIMENDPIQMAKAINQIYLNPKVFQKMRFGAKDYIMNHFTWDIYEKELLNVIEKTLENDTMLSECSLTSSY